MVAALNGYDDRLTTDHSFYNNINFTKAFRQTVAHHLGFSNFRPIRQVYSDEVYKSLEVI